MSLFLLPTFKAGLLRAGRFFCKRQVMRRTPAPEHPWYMLQCRLCRRHKHTLAFRRRRTRPGQIVVCKDCEQREPTGLPIPVSVHR